MNTPAEFAVRIRCRAFEIEKARAASELIIPAIAMVFDRCHGVFDGSSNSQALAESKV